MKPVLTRLLGTVLLLTVFGLVALVTLPASWLLRLTSPQALLHMTAAEGTVWSGQALLGVGQAGYARSIAPSVQWQTTWDPWPAITIRHPWLSHPVILRPQLSGLSVSAASLQLPASLLATLDARLAALQPAGQLTLQWPASQFAWTRRNDMDWQLSLLWTQASTALSHVKPIGSYRLSLRPGQDENIALQLATLSGPLKATGTGHFSASQGLTFNGLAELDPFVSGTDQASLSELLALIAPPQQGKTVLRVP